mgnify:FL=1
MAGAGRASACRAALSGHGSDKPGLIDPDEKTIKKEE